MRNWISAPLVGAILFGGMAQAQTPTVAPDPTTRVDEIAVVGGRVKPTTEDPKSATCEFLVATDPFLRAQIQAARAGGNALLGPPIYQPTRFPIKVDYVAAPLSPPGSALPEIGRQYRSVTTRSATTADIATEGGVTRTLSDLSRPESNVFESTEESPSTGAPTDFSTDDAINACRTFQNAGGSASATSQGAGTAVWGVDWGTGKYEIAYRDKMLPTAFALFEEHRYAESLDYFQRAFAKLSYDQGGDEAALMIGKLYLGAPGVERDMTKAVIWLKKAAGAKFDPVAHMPIFDPREPTRNTAIGEAAMILGVLYQGGAPGLAKDPADARKWFDRARHVGHVRACLVLGDIYYYGKDTPRDLKQAFRYYKEGATFADAPAQQALAEMYYSGDAPGGQDLKLALAWHNEAAKAAHAPSLYALATAYEGGEGVPADPERALGLYKLAATEGSPAARNVLGTYFYEGRGVQKDASVARLWFQQAATAGDPDAMFNLGAMMMKGEGGEVDRTRAWVWMKIAQRSEHPQALAAVGVLEARMTAEEKADAAKLLAPNA